MPIPEERYTDLAIDFFEPPFPSNGFDNVALVIDRLTKLARLSPAKKTDDAAQTARRFIESVFRYQGLPDRAVTDRGSIWTSEFWSAMCLELGIEQQLATARHQQTDGQAEKAVGVIKTMIRTYMGAKKEDWLKALPILEFAHNSTPHTLTGISPHMLACGAELVASTPIEKLQD